MKVWHLAVGLVVVGIPSIPTLAQSAADLASKIINDVAAPVVEGTATAKLVQDPEVQGGKALRVTVPRKGDHNWDVRVESALNKPVKAGDKIVLAFDARLEKGENGATTAALPYSTVQLKADPYTSVIGGPATVGPAWQLEKIEGTASKDYGAGDLKASIQIGNAKQIIDFGPIMVFDMGQ